MSTPSKTVNPAQKHNRDVWFKIVAPIMLPFVGLVGLCIVLVFAAATGTVESQQITIVMGVVSTLCLAIPVSLLCLVGCVVMFAFAYAGGWGYAHVRTPLRALRRLTESVAAQTNRLAPKIARPTTALNIQLARLEHSLRNWIAPSGEKETPDGTGE